MTTYSIRQLDADTLALRSLLDFTVRSLGGDTVEVRYYPGDVAEDDLVLPWREVAEDFGEHVETLSRKVDRFDGEVTEVWAIGAMR